jgi:hypothetical protein
MKIIIGDIHACRAELEELLDKIGFGKDDQAIALGDIFDRGPDNRGILRLFTENPQFLTLKGNHERKHLLINKNKCKAALSQMITKEELGDDYPRLLSFARNLPLYIKLDEAILVHGAIEPGIPLENQDEKILVSSIGGEKYLERLSMPWYELVDFGKPVIFGHKVYETPFILKNRVYGIDTGCCRGGSLTAITLPDFRIYSVKARENYWKHNSEGYKQRHPELFVKKKKEKHPGLNIEKTYGAVTELADKLKSETSSRKEFAAEVKKRNLPSVLFRAYAGKLTLDFIRKIDASKLGDLAKYK